MERRIEWDGVQYRFIPLPERVPFAYRNPALSKGWSYTGMNPIRAARLYMPVPVFGTARGRRTGAVFH